MTENRTEEVLDKINRYRSLVRLQYSQMEQLMRYTVLKEYYGILENATHENVISNVEFAEQLSKDLKMPLKVKGLFLLEGRPAAKFYKSDELKKAASNPINVSFPLMLDHKDREAGKVVGMVDKIEYDEKLKGLKWWGHINDETHARNVMDGAIKEVSVTVYSTSGYDELHGLIGTDLTFKELSLVMEGAVKGNYIEVDDDEDDEEDDD